MDCLQFKKVSPCSSWHCIWQQAVGEVTGNLLLFHKQKGWDVYNWERYGFCKAHLFQQRMPNPNASQIVTPTRNWAFKHMSPQWPCSLKPQQGTCFSSTYTKTRKERDGRTMQLWYLLPNWLPEFSHQVWLHLGNPAEVAHSETDICITGCSSCLLQY